MDLASSAPFSNASAKTSSSGTNSTSKVSVTVKPASSRSRWSFAIAPPPHPLDENINAFFSLPVPLKLTQSSQYIMFPILGNGLFIIVGAPSAMALESKMSVITSSGPSSYMKYIATSTSSLMIPSAIWYASFSVEWCMVSKITVILSLHTPDPHSEYFPTIGAGFFQI